MPRLVIELTASSLRCLHVEGRGRFLRVRQFLVDPLLPEESAGERLSRLIRGRGVRHRVAMSAMPRDQCLTRLLTLPTTRDDELAQMLELAGNTQFPYPPDATVVDVAVVNQHAGATTVRLVACQRERIEQHLAILRLADIEPLAITPSSWAVCAWYQRLGRGPDIQEPSLIVNVDDDHSDLVLVHTGRVLWSRVISQGFQAWQDASEWLSLLMQECEQSLAMVRREGPGVDVRMLVLTGLGPLGDWKGIIEQRLGKPVVVRDAHGRLRLPASPSDAGASPVVVLGLAVADAQELVDLLPPEIRQARVRHRRLQDAILTGGLCLAACWLGVGLLAAQVRRQERVVAQTASVLNQLESLAEQTEQRARNLSLFERVIAGRRVTATMLAELLRLTPTDVDVSRLAFERSRGELVVGGSASTTRQALDYLRQLQRSAQWERVDLRYAARRSTRAQSRTDFELVLRCREMTG